MVAEGDTMEKKKKKKKTVSPTCSKSQKLLGIKLGNKLKFDSHAENICQETGGRLKVLARLTKRMELPKGRILRSAFLKLSSTTTPLFG